MELSDATKLAIELMCDHNLDEWYFYFDKSKRIFGKCNYLNKSISLSKHLVLLNNYNSVKNTILHEIAHAIVGMGNGHNNIWKKKAIEIGCDGNRCYSSENTICTKGNYYAICHNCNKRFERHRKSKKNQSCGVCSKGIYNENFKLNWKINN